MSKSFFKKSARAFLFLIGFICSALLILSLLAPVTETIMLPVSVRIYAFLHSFCHQMPSRSLWYANSNFGVCSHCFGVLAGVGLGACFLAGCRSPSKFLNLCARRVFSISFLLVAPLMLDIFVDYFRGAVNPQGVRVLTGLMAGSGALFFVSASFFKITMWVSRHLLILSEEGLR
ncbi:MAG: hypothetical protein A3G87_05715 [Omnitrophica bacterium RIFCSPLOWO2_12_FULL_50_11]|nr:MAG: hypothetical protein A3G87_05715 [Omnitrophica bacterium RIFCSPLOWO2_12_FULL_50_11]